MKPNSEANIENLKSKAYSERRQLGYEGQKAAIRFMDTEDAVDMGRLKAIEKLQSEFFLPGMLSDDELIDWSKSKGKELMWVAVSGNEGVSDEEKGEMQGWILFTPDEPSRVREMRKKQTIGPVEKGQQVIEVAYAKVPDAAPGQISSALRESCMKFSRRDAARFQVKEQEERAKFDAEMAKKADAGLSLEQQIAERNKFEEDMMYKFTKPRTTITAYVDPRNDKSSKLLESAGFVKRGIIDYEGFPEEHKSHELYVLDWDLLHQRMQKDADKSLLDKLKGLSQIAE